MDVSGLSTCRQVFVVHAARVAGKWVWDKLIVTANTDIASCGLAQSLALEQANRVWFDDSTGSVYIVGSQAGDNNNQPTSSNATRQLEMVLRIKTK